MTSIQIITALTLSAFIIALWVALAVRLHPYWVESTLRHALHTAGLWFLVEYRARQAARNHPGPGRTLRTVITGTQHRASHPDNPVVLAFAYRPADPYAIRVVASTRDTITIHTFARDLLTQALTTGTAGEGRIRIHRTSRRACNITVDPGTPAQITTYQISARPLERALSQWHDLVPTGTEHIYLAPAFDAELTALLHTTEPT